MFNPKVVMTENALLVSPNKDFETTAIINSKSFVQEWTSLFNIEDKKLEVKTDHPFVVSLDLKYPKFVDVNDDLNVARVFLGIKDQQKGYKESIEMGVYMGRIYIKDIFDVVNIPKSSLINGVKIVLQVSPTNFGKKCRTILSVIDHTGVEISSIKTGKFITTDWSGGISTGAHFKSLRIEGIQS